MSRLLDFVLDNKSKADKSWKKELQAMNVWDDVEDIYSFTKDNYNGNIILSFIALAYDAKSEYIEMHQDRLDNKIKIMQSLAGLSALTNDTLKAVVHNTEDVFSKVIDWFLESQKDWRWKTVVTCYEYHSVVMQMKPSVSAKDTLEIGRCIDEAIKRRNQGDKLLKEMQTEFVNLDHALKKEGKRPVTSMDFMSHEQFISNRKLKKEKTV